MERSDATAQWSATRGISRRPLRVFAYDPMVDRFQPSVVARVPFELVEPGPAGRLVEVVDVDGSRGTALPPLDLDDPQVLLNQGLPCAEIDPRSHQQMVYAVAMVVLEAFERGLGRALVWERRQRLRLVPHAGAYQDTLFDPASFAVLFGYFAAHSREPGNNVPGQTVFTCLSYDMIAHSVAHPALASLRPADAIGGAHQDAAALHEGIADLVAMLVRATSREVVARAVRQSGVDLRRSRTLFRLAMQSGEAADIGEAVRSYPEPVPVRQDAPAAIEPHARGALLASAVIDAYLDFGAGETADLVRFHGGPGEDGWLHPDLVDRLAGDYARMARELLRSAVAALDYLPAVGPAFGDYLSAFVTADAMLYGARHGALRAAMIRSFQRRGMLPAGITSLAEVALTWPELDPDPGLRVPHADTALLFSERALEWRRRWATDRRLASELEAVLHDDAEQCRVTVLPGIAGWVAGHRDRLGLGPGPVTAVALSGAHHADADGNIRSRVFVQLTQPASPGEVRGVTLVCDADGAVRHCIRPHEPGPVDLGWTGGPIPPAHRELAETVRRFLGGLA